MKNRRFWVLTILPLAVTAFVLQFMPDRIPAHYNFAGEIDRWGSKYECFILPVIIIALAVFWEALCLFYNNKAKNSAEDKQRAETLNNVKVMRIAAVATTAVFNALHYVNLYNAYISADSGLANLEIDSIKITCFLMGILFIILGNVLPKTKLNGTIGLRITYSMYNDITWSKSNRFGGFALMITGILTAITSVIFNSVVSLILMLVFLTVAIIVMIMYAKKIYEEEKEQD